MTDAGLARIARAAGAIGLAMSMAGCAGSALFPVRATMPATWDQAYAEVRGEDPDTAQLSEPTRLFLTDVDPLRDKPRMPVRPPEPRAPLLATDPFPLAPLRMPERPPSSTVCATIAASVGGPKARCAKAADEELAGQLPDGVPSDAVIIGKAYGDGRMILLERPGQGQAMWDAAMHERGHLLATWLCGRADCLDDDLVARGHADDADYLGSLVEGFAQSWAQCHGAAPRPEYRRLPCADVAAVVAQAHKEKQAAKDAYARAQEPYAAELATYEEELRAYDRRSAELATLVRFAATVSTPGGTSSSPTPGGTSSSPTPGGTSSSSTAGGTSSSSPSPG